MNMVLSEVLNLVLNSMSFQTNAPLNLFPIILQEFLQNRGEKDGIVLKRIMDKVST